MLLDGSGVIFVQTPVAVSYFQTSPMLPSYGPPWLL